MLSKETLKHLLWEGERVLGEAVFAAKCSVISRYPTNDNYYGPAVLWTLLGDPALRVKHRLLTGVEEGAAPPAPGIEPGPARIGSAACPVPLAPGEECYDALGRRVEPVRPGVYITRRGGRTSGRLVITR